MYTLLYPIFTILLKFSSLPLRPTPLDIQPPSRSRGADLDVSTTMYCISRHVNAGFASSVSAQSPAASGAEADVPENDPLIRM